MEDQTSALREARRRSHHPACSGYPAGEVGHQFILRAWTKGWRDCLGRNWWSSNPCVVL